MPVSFPSGNSSVYESMKRPVENGNAYTFFPYIFCFIQANHLNLVEFGVYMHTLKHQGTSVKVCTCLYLIQIFITYCFEFTDPDYIT